jgi:hypothetical protein
MYTILVIPIRSRILAICGYVVSPVQCGSKFLIVYPQQQYSLDHIPTLFVATKSDLDLALQVRLFLSVRLWSNAHALTAA